MRYYAVSDVHGFYTCMEQALRQAGFFEDKGPKKLVLCGDALDRGEEPHETVRFLLELLERDQLVYILGNHEDLAVRCLQEIARGGVMEVLVSHHARNGTWRTLHQLAEMDEADAIRYPHRLVSNVMHSPYYRELLPRAVDYLETPTYIFVHGWVPVFMEGLRGYERYTRDPHWREAETVRWQMARWLNGMEMVCRHGFREAGKTVVCGHIHASKGHAEFGHCRETVNLPFAAEGILSIDGHTLSSGLVNCVVIEE